MSAVSMNTPAMEEVGHELLRVSSALTGNAFVHVPSASAAEEALGTVRELLGEERAVSEVLGFEIDVAYEGLELVRTRTIGVDHFDRLDLR